MYTATKVEEGKPVQFLGIYALKWPWHSGVEPTMMFSEVNEWEIFERAVKLLTRTMEEIDAGSPRWTNRGGQSHGWKVFHWLQKRYDVPHRIGTEIVNGYLRW